MRRRALLPVLSLSVLLLALSQSALVPALPALERTYATSADDTAWVLTAFLIVAAVASPVAGRLGSLIGRRRVLLVLLALHLAGSLVCALAASLGPVIAGRALQGCVAGAFTLAIGLARDLAAPDRARSAVAVVSVVVGAGTGSGFALGGAVVDLWSVTAMFWGGAAFAVVTFALTALTLSRDRRAAHGRVDVLGGVLLVAGIALALLAISQGNRWGWISARTVAAAMLGALLLAAWVGVERRRTQPLVDIAALRARPVLLCNVATFLLGCAMFGLFVLTPQLAQQAPATGYGLGLGVTGAGLVLLPGALATLCMAPLASRVAARLGDHAALAIGAGTTTLGLAMLAGAGGGLGRVVAWSVLAAVGLGIAMPAMPALVAGAVAAQRVGDAVGFNTMLRGVGSAVGVQASAAVLAASAAANAGAAPTRAGYAAAYALAAGAAAAAGLIALGATAAGGGISGSAGARRGLRRGWRVGGRRRGGRSRCRSRSGGGGRG